MPARHVVLVLVLGVSLPSSSIAIALAQTQRVETQLAPLPAQAADAGPLSETESDAALVVVMPGPAADSGGPLAHVSDQVSSTTPAPSGCDRRYVHNGFYFGFSSSLGHLAVWGDGPTGSASISGYASGGTIAVGGSPVPGFALAGVIGATSTSGDTFNGGPVVTATTTAGSAPSTPMKLSGRSSATMFLLGALADWFPVPTGGWHVGGTVGLGGAVVTDETGNAIGGASVAGSVFGGYQWWLGPSWSLGVSGVVMGAPTLNMTDSNRNDSGYKMAPLFAGVQGLLLFY